MKNKIITSEGNIQFIDSEGKVINISPSQVYSVINEDTVSFILVHLPKSSGLSLFTTKVEDLELNGTTYSQSTIADALAEAFSEAGAVGRIEVVDELPSEGKTNTIYLLPKDEGEGYDEYIYLKDEQRWELVGDTSVEIKNYLKKSDFNEYSAATKTAIDSKQDALIAGKHITISGNVISAEDVDLSDYYTKSETSGATEIQTALDTKVNTSDFNTYSANTQTAINGKANSADVYTKAEVDEAIAEIDLSEIEDRISEDEEVTAAALNNLDEKKLDASAYTPTDLSDYYTKSQVYTKAETKSAISAATSGKADSSSVYTYVAADDRISVETTTGKNRKAIGLGVNVYKGSGSRSLSLISKQDTAQGGNNIKGALSAGIGWGLSTNNSGEVAVGQFNKSVSASTLFGDSGNTLFSVGNGQYQNVEKNAFEIRQNGDIYITSGLTNIKLQDHLGGGGSITVDTALDSGSTNPVENKAIWSAATYNKGVLLTFNGRDSTNYPEGCGKLVVENNGLRGVSEIRFMNDKGHEVGFIHIDSFDNISVDTRHFEGASYEIDGTTVIISYPSTGITSVDVNETRWTYTAVIEGAWVNENTYMKAEIDAIANGLQNNINAKLDATAYTPTVVDSALNVASQNPVQNQALYSELRFPNGETETTLTFENEESTNYPNGCTKLIVEVAGSNNLSEIEFYNNNQRLGRIHIENSSRIYVDVRFDGASYVISGTTVIINYPTVASVTKIRVNGDGNYVYKAIAALATPLKDQVVANTNKIDEIEDRLSEDEEVTAAGLNALNDKFDGLKLKKISQTDYDNLQTKDNMTLYIIVD